MTIKPVIVPILNALLWLLVAYAGIEGLLGIDERGAVAATGQIVWYGAIPLVLEALAIVSVVASIRGKSTSAANTWSLFSIFLFLPWAFLAGGGV
jgi:hypothetical protein